MLKKFRACPKSTSLKKNQKKFRHVSKKLDKIQTNLEGRPIIQTNLEKNQTNLEHPGSLIIVGYELRYRHFLTSEHLESYPPGINMYIQCINTVCQATSNHDAILRSPLIHVHTFPEMYVHVRTILTLYQYIHVNMYVHGTYTCKYKHVCTLFVRVRTCIYMYIHILTFINM